MHIAYSRVHMYEQIQHTQRVRTLQAHCPPETVRFLKWILQRRTDRVGSRNTKPVWWMVLTQSIVPMWQCVHSSRSAATVFHSHAGGLAIKTSPCEETHDDVLCYVLVSQCEPCSDYKQQHNSFLGVSPVKRWG